MTLAGISRAFAALAIGFLFASSAAAQAPVSLAAVRDHEQAASERIERALVEDTTLEFVDTPFKDIIAFLADQHDITIVLAKKIEDAGVEPGKVITMTLRRVTLESALNRLLGDLNLTFMIKDQVLIITTVEDAQSPENMIVRVYPVADLLYKDEYGYDFDPLIDLIQSTIEPDSWQDVGGPGSINGHSETGSLVFAQRRDIHQRIEALLATLRRVRRLQNIAPHAARVADSSSTPPLSRSLSVPRRPSTSRRYAAPESATQFQGGGGGLFSVPNR